ncbi:type I restriction endonuclease subunit R [Methylophilaceae bacterium]|nr:type I restriction endonuclease subunit R [Methylophilaceae bacterium]
MVAQSEQVLENKLIEQLVGLSYERVKVESEADLLTNLQSQLEKHNKTTFSASEFKRIMNHLEKGTVFEKAKILRDKFALTCDDGTTKWIDFLDSNNFTRNHFQVTNQVTIEGTYKNRYDVTVLINGLPLCHLELKRRGAELKQAFNQINRYQRHSFGANTALFQYVQIFVISNGVNTKYYANNKKQSYQQTYHWADKSNTNITNLDKFTDIFLERSHLAKMIGKYIVLQEANKILMVLRPYQYYAAEAIIDRVQNSDKNGYIWHTTGSGKTLTSFKAAQIIMDLPKVHKVVFVVDRKDLDYQTTKEFNSFSDGSVDGTDNTGALVKQFADSTKLIVTTIQKLNNAITRERHLKVMDGMKDKHIVFIFDECHRSQFGETHLNITKFFEKNQMFGFTGTPIFAKNAMGEKIAKRTTAELFDESLHKYVISDAIADENVLRFSVEYIGRYKERDGTRNNIDIEVENIDVKELLDSEARIEKIVDYVIANHDRKTHAQEFNSMFAVSSIEVLTKYYELFRKKKAEGKHNLKVATIFSYSANEDDSEANGIYDNQDNLVDEKNINQHSRDKLESYIDDYNKMFNSAFTTKDSQSFYNYNNDISKRVKNRDIDILLVVNMFLTGFDAPTLNTLYVDKNLKYHGLIQAFSRTNRILNEKKAHGNIVCFRNLKDNTDDAISLYSNKDNKDEILLKPYDDYVKLFNEAFLELFKIAPSMNAIDGLVEESQKLLFIKAFREVMRVKNVLAGFVEFSFDDISMTEQQLEDYQSKYLDMYESIKHSQTDEKVSILNDVDFETELLARDIINVEYILRLLRHYRDASPNNHEAIKKQIMNTIGGQEHLRSKRELIEKFIDTQLLNIDGDAIESEYDNFIEQEKLSELGNLCREENLKEAALRNLIETYIYDLKEPLSDDIREALVVKPKLLESKSIILRVKEKVLSYVDKFYEL